METGPESYTSYKSIERVDLSPEMMVQMIAAVNERISLNDSGHWNRAQDFRIVSKILPAASYIEIYEELPRNGYEPDEDTRYFAVFYSQDDKKLPLIPVGGDSPAEIMDIISIGGIAPLMNYEVEKGEDHAREMLRGRIKLREEIRLKKEKKQAEEMKNETV